MRQLYSIYHILSDLDNPHISQTEIEGLSKLIIDTAFPLHGFLQQPPPPRNAGTTVIQTGKPGRPRYNLNLERTIELHNLGCSWNSIALAIGVTRQTLYNHLQQAGLTTERPVYTVISDDDLDELVAGISLNHPFAGSSIIRGHLEVQGVKVPALRVQDSLKRVDPIGVFVR